MRLNIIEGNKLIAEFIGWSENGFYPTPFDDAGCVNGEASSICREWNLKFHSSWNWLMPVVEKIESIHTNDDCRHKGYELCMNGKIDAYFLNPSTGETVVSVPFCDFDDNNSQPMPTIEVVWRLCVEFLKWYNNQQSK